MAKNTKAISFEDRVYAIFFLMILEVVLFYLSIWSFSYHEYGLGFVLAGIGIILILSLLSRLISRLLNRYKLGTKHSRLYKRLRTKDHEVDKIKTTIESFKQAENWPNEAGYQADLYNFLKRNFPDAKLEERTGASRPDIIIKDIAIELKGPTTNEGINSLPAKCIKYSKYYRKIIFVLFSPKFSQSNFIEIKKGIEETFPGRTIFIIKQNI